MTDHEPGTPAPDAPAGPGEPTEPQPAPTPSPAIPAGPPQRPANGFATAALVLGIIAVASAALGFMIITIPLAFVAAVLAIIFGILTIRAANRGEPTNRSQGVAGLITGSVALGMLVLGGIALGVLIGVGDWDRHDGPFDRRHDDDFEECVEDARDAEDVRDCILEYPEEAREAELFIRQ